jgi:flagellar export protein FliJ
MAKFKFRLATLLRLRQSVRDERRAALAQAYRAEEILRGQHGQLAGALEEVARHCQEALSPGQVNIDQVLEARRYELVLKSQQQEIGRQQQAVEAEIEHRRGALSEANREVRVLEKLRDRQQDRYRQEENRREIKELDEVAGRRAVRGEVP